MLRFLIGWVRLVGNLDIFAASHREKETQKHKLVKNNKNRQVGNRALEHLL
jgi:hypothetical protein